MKRIITTLICLFLTAMILVACADDTPPTETAPPDTSSESDEATESTETEASETGITEVVSASTGGGAAARAVDLVGAWVDAGSPESEPFDYTGIDGNSYQATFDVDILPLFTNNGVWFENSPACLGCHFGSIEESAHEMDLGSHEGILAGADVLEDPPGVSIVGESEPGAGDFNWGESELRARLRDNRMPPGFPFDRTEENRDGPTLEINGVEVRAVDLLGVWVDASVPETEPFGDYEATFNENILPLFTESDAWFDDSPACASCHTGNTEASSHEMDLTSYAGILAGADVLEDPPGVSLLGESEPGAGDYNWGESELRARLRDNRMPPGFPFDITEANRDGPLMLHGEPVTGVVADQTPFGSGDCEVRAVNLIGAWVDAGAPDGEFAFTAEDDSACTGEFEADVLPLFTESGAWFENSLACTDCHNANSEASAHEMDLSNHAAILAGADVLEDPPGESILGESEPGVGDFNWGESELRARLRDNRMPPDTHFDLTEENRDGPVLLINGAEVRAVDLLADWVAAGVPETESFGNYEATFGDNVLPLFTVGNAWFGGSSACASCHSGTTEASAHEMDLTSYAGIIAGADVLEDPPGVSLLGESTPGSGDFDWDGSEMRARLRDNRMPPGFPFDISEANRDGRLVLAGTKN
ncbi:MAG: hypothetical protein GY796_35110 [Chloroflexi bacterium]|nr:hypothetical protein [Chloroflexota bacterium]